MKLSEVNIDITKKFLRIDYDHDDELIGIISESAKGYIRSFTGLPDGRLDEYPEIVHAYICLCSDMYDNNTVSAANVRENPTVRQILLSVAENYV